jgi:hypothetical protein
VDGASKSSDLSRKHNGEKNFQGYQSGYRVEIGTLLGFDIRDTLPVYQDNNTELSDGWTLQIQRACGCFFKNIYKQNWFKFSSVIYIFWETKMNKNIVP